MSNETIERARSRPHVTPFTTPSGGARPSGQQVLAEIVVSYRSSIVEVVHLDPASPPFSVGESPAASFKLGPAQLPDPAATTLVQPVGAGYMLTIPPSFEAIVERSGRRLPHGSLVELVEGVEATLRHGDVRFDIALVEREAVSTKGAPLDRPFLASVIGNATLATAALLLLQAMPADGMAIAIDDEAAAARFASYFEQADQRPAPEPSEAESTQATTEAGRAGEAGAQAKGRKSERRQARATKSSLPLRGPGRAGPGLSRDSDLAVSAGSTGILAMLAAQDQSFLASAEGAFGSSEADALLWANTSGLGGLGVAGLELTSGTHDGGGTASGVVGLAGTGLLGHGPGSDGLSYGGLARHGERRARVPIAVLREPETTPNIDKDVIRRIVRGHLNEIRGCYNAGLTRNPGLAGRVTVQFSILAGGKVAGAVIEQNTTGDAPVGDCIAKAVKRWKFPAVRGGTALVSYPFQLRSR